MQADDEFMRELRRFSGTPEAVLQSRELMEMFIPILRADFTVDETYIYFDATPLDCPIFTFGGTEDIEAEREDIKAWANHTTKDFSLEMIKGEHFFLQTERDRLLQSVSRILVKLKAYKNDGGKQDEFKHDFESDRLYPHVQHRP